MVHSKRLEADLDTGFEGYVDSLLGTSIARGLVQDQNPGVKLLLQVRCISLHNIWCTALQYKP